MFIFCVKTEKNCKHRENTWNFTCMAVGQAQGWHGCERRAEETLGCPDGRVTEGGGLKLNVATLVILRLKVVIDVLMVE